MHPLLVIQQLKPGCNNPFKVVEHFFLFRVVSSRAVCCMLNPLVALQSMETKSTVMASYHNVIQHFFLDTQNVQKILSIKNFHNIFTSPKVDIFLNFGAMSTPLLTNPPLLKTQAFYVEKNLALQIWHFPSPLRTPARTEGAPGFGSSPRTKPKSIWKK